MNFISLYNSCVRDGLGGYFNTNAFEEFLKINRFGIDVRDSISIIQLDDSYVPYGSSRGKFYVKKSESIRDPFNNNYYHKEDFTHYLYLNDEVHKTVLDVVSCYRKVKLHRHGEIFCEKGAINFAEHSGAGFGQIKKFTIPEGEAYGIEIECCVSGYSEEDIILKKIKVCNEIFERFGWTAERDGSLEDGVGSVDDTLRWGCLEIVSPPLSYETLTLALSGLANIMQKHGVTAKYGDFFAIHITSNVPDHNRQVKMLSTVMAEENRLFWLKASGRPRFKGFDSNSNKPYCQFLNIDHYPDVDKMKVCSYHGNTTDHYRAMFVRNSSAVELRIFKTVVDLEWILGIVELNRCLYLYGGLTTPIKFIDYVSQQREHNPTLNNYLTRNSL